MGIFQLPPVALHLLRESSYESPLVSLAPSPPSRVRRKEEHVREREKSILSLPPHSVIHSLSPSLFLPLRPYVKGKKKQEGTEE